MKQETAKRQGVKCPHTSRPYAGDRTSHTADYCAVPILSNNHGLFKREKWECVFGFQRCRDIAKPCAAFVVSAAPSEAQGGREDPTPTGRTVETERKIMWKENTR